MAMSDVISDALTRLRNAQGAKHDTVLLNLNGTVRSILGILQSEGFIDSFSFKEEKGRNQADVTLRYYQNKPVIRGIERVSKPGRRIYHKADKLVATRNNIGISIYSTPKGVLTDKEARVHGVGGEFLCRVW